MQSDSSAALTPNSGMWRVMRASTSSLSAADGSPKSTCAATCLVCIPASQLAGKSCDQWVMCDQTSTSRSGNVQMIYSRTPNRLAFNTVVESHLDAEAPGRSSAAHTCERAPQPP